MRRCTVPVPTRVSSEVRSGSSPEQVAHRLGAGRRTSRASRRRGWRRSRRRPGGGRRRASRTPDSATLTTPSGIAVGHPRGPLVVDLERHEVALVDADQRRPGVRGRSPARARRGPRRARRARASSPAAWSSISSTRSSAATISSTASAPISRASATSRGDDREVLAQHGQRASRPGRCLRSSIDPPKNSSSVSTDRHVAPPASYASATGAGSRSTFRAPFDGERRLISAITASPGDAASAARKPARRRHRLRRRRRGRRADAIRRRHLAVAGEDAVEVGDRQRPLPIDRRQDLQLGTAAGEVAQATCRSPCMRSLVPCAVSASWSV